MGDYGRQAKSDTFIKKKETGANNDIARLAGARFVSAIESEDGEQLSETFATLNKYLWLSKSSRAPGT
ncbi:hypothetical protein ACUOA8_60050, partial [Escherichia sp. SS-MK2]